MTSLQLPDVTPEITTHLRRFIHLDQAMLVACARISPRVAQLAISFPLLFAALANAYDPLKARTDAVSAAVNGASLREIANIVGLPYCFRQISPEGCPKSLQYHHWNPNAHLRLRPLIPNDDAVTRYWLPTLFLAAQRSDEEVAIWMARQQCPLLLSRLRTDSLQPLFMFAWYSLHYPAIVHPRGRWTPAISLRSAIKRCDLWLKHLALFTELDVKGVADPWLPETRASALHIVPITTPADILVEASAMENCVVDYGELIANGTCRLFSVRLGGQRVATLQLNICPDRERLMIGEIKGFKNQPCPIDVYAQVSDVVSRYEPRHFSTELCRPPDERTGLMRCLVPYRKAKCADEQAWLAKLSVPKMYADHDQLSRLLRGRRPVNW